MALRAFLERFNRILFVAVWAVGSAPPEVLKSFRKMTVNKALGGEGNFPIFYLASSKIPNLHMDLFTDVLRDHNLKFIFYRDCDYGDNMPECLTVQSVQ